MSSVGLGRWQFYTTTGVRVKVVVMVIVGVADGMVVVITVVDRRWCAFDVFSLATNS